MNNLDHPELADERAEFEARLETMGVEGVRMMMASGGFPTNHNVVIFEWLAAKTQEKKDA